MLRRLENLQNGTQYTVSVVMAAYNAASTIGESINSIRSQTLEDWELIVVDDGSTDGTFQLLEQMSSDSRIKVHRLEANSGKASARNSAIARATGRYVAIFDSDDIFLPRKLEIQVGFLDAHPEVHVVSCQMDYFSATVEPFRFIKFPERHEEIVRRFKRGSIGVPHGFAMVRAECFEKYGVYREGIPGAEDLELLLRYCNNGLVFHTLPETLGLYRKHGEDWNQPSFRQRSLMEFQRYYAIYRAKNLTEAGDARSMTFEQYSSLPTTKVKVYGLGLLRSLLFTLRFGLAKRNSNP